MAATDFHDLASAFVTLLVVVEPLGLAPIFLATTVGHSESSRGRIAVRACVYAFAILAGAAFGGERLLNAVGISLPAFHIAGGMLLFSIASEMVLGVRIRREAHAAARAGRRERTPCRGLPARHSAHGRTWRDNGDAAARWTGPGRSDAARGAYSLDRGRAC